jgi:hypothetical protein
MTLTKSITCAGLSAALCIAPSLTFGQDNVRGGPLTGPAVINAPFSADATTIIRQTLGDGTWIERRGVARYYRDRVGCVRVEQTITGIDGLNSTAAPRRRITIQPDPANRYVYTLDPGQRTALRGPRFAAGLAIGGGDTYAVPLGGPRFLLFNLRERAHGDATFDSAAHEELLGTKTVAGVEATGRRITVTIPAGHFGNDRPIELVDERWESKDLRVVVYARSSDPRTGTVEYQLTNISRAEPPAEMFSIPEGYGVDFGASDIWITLQYANTPKTQKVPHTERRR